MSVNLELNGKFLCCECENMKCSEEAHDTDEGMLCFDCNANKNIVFCCAECDTPIIRNSTEHDECWTCDDEHWFCGDCKESHYDDNDKTTRDDDDDYDVLQRQLLVSMWGLGLRRHCDLMRQFISKAEEAKKEEYEMFHKKSFQVRAVGYDDTICSFGGVWDFDTYDDALVCFNAEIEKRHYDDLVITETPKLSEDSWEIWFPDSKYPDIVFLKHWVDVEQKIGKEQYALWQQLKGTPEYDTYCGVPGCMNYMLGLPFYKYIVE